MGRRTCVGFGFGAIQGGLFLLESHQSGNFDRLVGSMRLALDAGVAPKRFALGAVAAVKYLELQTPIAAELNEIWVESGALDLKMGSPPFIQTLWFSGLRAFFGQSPRGKQSGNLAFLKF